MSPELADLFLKFLTKLYIFMQLNHALSVVFHGRKYFKKKKKRGGPALIENHRVVGKRPFILICNLQPHSTETQEEHCVPWNRFCTPCFQHAHSCWNLSWDHYWLGKDISILEGYKIKLPSAPLYIFIPNATRLTCTKGHTGQNFFFCTIIKQTAAMAP